MQKDLEDVLKNNFDMVIDGKELDTESEYFKRLQLALAARVELLINTNLEKLLQILYRVDVDQRLSDQAFELGEVKKISMKLAEVIIARQLRKIDYAKNFYKK